MFKLLYIIMFSLLILGGCSEKKEDSISAIGMKCGAGKCGANMFDGNSALAKKKMNILSQMRENDSRKECVIAAKTTKAVYNCVREANGKKLTIKCGASKYSSSASSMKCGAGRCGANMKGTNVKQTSSMKCSSGKCG